jgi:predicted P-loop ATPase
MYVFEGRQYAGKSFLSRIMGTVKGEEYFLDDFRDIENKDSLMKMQGKLVVEFPEISTMRRTEVNDLKGFLSRQEDVFRPPYGRNTITAARQCVFIGTVNPEGPYLRDVTGNRRYWPVSCRDKIPLDDLKEIMPQLHAEAAFKFKNGEQLWLTEHEFNLCAIEQNKRVQDDIWIDKIAEIANGLNELTMDHIMFEMGIAIDKRTQLTYNRIMQCMVSLGFSYGDIKKGLGIKKGFKKNI